MIAVVVGHWLVALPTAKADGSVLADGAYPLGSETCELKSILISAGVTGCARRGPRKSLTSLTWTDMRR